jgi:stage II sporulation protein AB (anti-sigma F factor)
MAANNRMHLKFLSLSDNESFARITIASFISQMNPTLDELTDIKTVISEAVTNCIIHGYENRNDGWIQINASIDEDIVTIEIIDEGRGIEDLEEARQPLFTSKPELERSGMGFTIMENFMDECYVKSDPGVGTTVLLKKRIPNQTLLMN